MDHNDLTGLFATLGTFGGVSLIIWTSMQAKIARIKAEAQVCRQSTAPTEDGAVLAELKALRQQMEQMQSTSHGFDLSFDEALGRLESRVGRVEARGAAPIASPLPEEVQRAGLR